VSRIDELISKLCPNGVPFEPISVVVQRGSTVRWADVEGQEFQYIDLTSVDRVTHAITDTQTITSEDAPSRAQQIVQEGDVLFGTTRPMLKRYTVVPPEYDRQIASTGYCVLRPKQDRILTNFLFHLLGTANFYAFVEANERGASYPAIPDGVLKQFKIPIPPVEVQREIVQVLDLFTELEAELGAELEARQLQYAHYRDSLLTFEGTEVQRIPLGELARIVRGASPRPIQAFITDAEDGVPWIKIGDVAAGGKYITSTAQRVTPEGAAKSRRVYTGDFVLSNSMSFGRPYISKIEGCIHDGWLAISDFDESFVPDFLYHLLRSALIQAEFARRAGAGAVQNLNADIVKSVAVPVPSLGEQKRIVRVLDKFEMLVNDISVGLPAELNARRKQYEHYRDRLVSLKELAA
jgi:type I restriction enzyme S subunit